MVKCCMICRDKNYDYYHKGREGGGQRVMIEIIISENDDNDGRPLRFQMSHWKSPDAPGSFYGQYETLTSHTHMNM